MDWSPVASVSVPAACSVKWRLSVCIRAPLHHHTHAGTLTRDMHEGIRITRARLAGAKWLRVRRTKPIKIYLRARASANVVSTKFEKNPKESLRRFLPLPLCCSCRLGVRKISARNGRAVGFRSARKAKIGSEKCSSLAEERKERRLFPSQSPGLSRLSRWCAILPILHKQARNKAIRSAKRIKYTEYRMKLTIFVRGT